MDRCSKEVSWVTIAVLAQAILRNLTYVLPIDENTALLHIVSAAADLQVDLPAPERPTIPTFSPAAICKLKSLKTCHSILIDLMIDKANVIESDSSGRDLEWSGRIHHRLWLREVLMPSWTIEFSNRSLTSHMISARHAG